MFDPDDIDAAFEELDARYVAGEAAAHAHTWSVMARVYAALNRRETARRRQIGSTLTTGDTGPRSRPANLPHLLATWDLAPDVAPTSRLCIG